MYQICGLFNGLCNAILWTAGLGTTHLIIYRKFKKYVYSSYINAGLFQIFLTIWAVYNIYNRENSYAIDNSMLGYYIYDTISSFLDPSGIQYSYIIHHTVAIYMIYLNNTYQFSPFVYRNILYFLMESSAGMLNWMKLDESKYKFKVLTYSVFGITRCIIYPICIINYVNGTYKTIWFHDVHLVLLSIIYIASCYSLTKWVYELKKFDLKKDYI